MGNDLAVCRHKGRVEEQKMTALSHRSIMTVEEYLELDRNSLETRYEYIDGHVRELTEGTLDHSTIEVNLISMLSDFLRGSAYRVCSSDAPIRISETRYVYPDVTVSCDEQDQGRTDIVQSPRLMVEILSPSTEAYNRGRKFMHYRRCPTIQEYMMIDSQLPLIEIFRREKNDLWMLYTFGLQDIVELTSINVRFPASDVYEGITFPTDGIEPL
jgi:Uma2 family endonuclease